jgi:hypothetical protein
MSNDPRCRGWLLSGVAAYLDEPRHERLLGLASPELRGFLTKPEARRDDWIPLAWIVEALTLADGIAGSGDLALTWKIGAFVAAREVGVVQTLALKLLRPPMIMSLASGLWVTHYRHAGRVVARGRGDRDMLVSFLDVPETSRALCLSIGGWIEGFLGLGPRHDIDVRHVACRGLGAAVCEFSVTWEE